MPRLADKTLVAAHETMLERWKRTKPEQYWKLHESVRQDPVYRPLRPSDAEKEFYRERKEYLETLPRFRLRDRYDPAKVEGDASNAVVIVEDRERMGVYRATASEIERGDVDWREDVLAFAREALRNPQAVESSADIEPADDPWLERGLSAYIFELFPMSVVRNTAASRGIDESEVYRALDELQVALVGELPTLVEEYDVEAVADGHVVLTVDETFVDERLFGYSKNVRSAAAAAHARRSNVQCDSGRQSIIVGGSETLIRRTHNRLE